MVCHAGSQEVVILIACYFCIRIVGCLFYRGQHTFLLFSACWQIVGPHLSWFWTVIPHGVKTWQISRMHLCPELVDGLIDTFLIYSIR